MRNVLNATLLQTCSDKTIYGSNAVINSSHFYTFLLLIKVNRYNHIFGIDIPYLQTGFEPISTKNTRPI